MTSRERPLIWGPTGARTRRQSRIILTTLISVSLLFVALGQGKGQDPNWVDVSPSVAPAARGDHAMVYDIASDRSILFGGASRIGGPTPVDGTWAYDSTAGVWKSLGPANRPSLRFGHTMAYDNESHRTILFGGIFNPEPETWAYDYNANTWTNMSPEAHPPSFFLPGMAYDEESDRIILFGGHTENSFIVGVGTDETWAYDYNENNWTRMDPNDSPAARAGPGMAYDAQSDRVILFGGAPAGINFGDTWAYDFNSDTWTRMSPAEAPSARHQPGMAYDNALDRVILFGGQRSSGPSDETWIYDFDSDVWTQMEDVGPSSRFGAVMVYDTKAERVILFGGVRHPTVFGDTWSYWLIPPAPAGLPWLLMAGIGVAAGVGVGLAFFWLRRRRPK